MKKTSSVYLIATAAMLLFYGCLKNRSQTVETSSNDLVKQAQSFFNNDISSQSKNPNINNYRACQPRSVNWGLAAVYHTTEGDIVVSPVDYRNFSPE